MSSPSIDTALLVLSGKGGVGKSTVSVQLALALAQAGKRVGLLDIDLCGPSVPRMLGLEGQRVHQCPEGWVPVHLPLPPLQQEQQQQQEQQPHLLVMSIGFLLEGRDDPVIWRGPKKAAMVGQFVRDVHWQGLDYLVVDTPPGTSDEHLAVLDSLKVGSVCRRRAAVVVTTPQLVAIGDVRRELGFCAKTGLQVAGLVENMSGLACPHCAHCSNVFSRGGGEELARVKGLPFLGCLPLDPGLAACLDEGRAATEALLASPAQRLVREATALLLEQLETSTVAS